MHKLIETTGGICELLLLFIRSGLRIRSKYWRWRMLTATGDEKLKLYVQLRYAIEYGRWIYRMKRLQR